MKGNRSETERLLLKNDNGEQFGDKQQQPLTFASAR